MSRRFEYRVYRKRGEGREYALKRRVEVEGRVAIERWTVWMPGGLVGVVQEVMM